MRLLAPVVSLAGIIGCGPGSEAKPLGNGASIFQATSYPVAAVLVGKDQKPIYLEALSINACPTSEARKCFSLAIKEYQDELGVLERAINTKAEEIATQYDLKKTAEQQIVQEYEKRRPSSSTASTTARNPLKSLSKARAEKDSADAWIEQQRLEQCEPIKDTIKALSLQRDLLNVQLATLKANFNDRLFNSLPSPTKTWKTGKDGRVSIDIPNDASWTVWSVASHEYTTGKVRQRRGAVSTNAGAAVYTETETEQDVRKEQTARWILEVPTDLDGNKTLYLDLTTDFDRRGFTVKTDGNDAPYFMLNGRR